MYSSKHGLDIVKNKIYKTPWVQTTNFNLQPSIFKDKTAKLILNFMNFSKSPRVDPGRRFTLFIFFETDVPREGGVISTCGYVFSLRRRDYYILLLFHFPSS